MTITDNEVKSNQEDAGAHTAPSACNGLLARAGEYDRVALEFDSKAEWFAKEGKIAEDYSPAAVALCNQYARYCNDMSAYLKAHAKWWIKRASKGEC